MLYMYSHNNGAGSKLLAEALGIKRLRHTGSKVRLYMADWVINWGSRKSFLQCNVLNTAEAVNIAQCKLSTFNTLSQGNSKKYLPKFWTNIEEARKWLHEGEGTRTLVCRTILRGSEGVGIVLTTNPLDIPPAPLYVEYVKKQAEYRIHVLGGEPIDMVRKILRKDYEGPKNYMIRNTANGFIFQRNGIQVPQQVIDAAVLAVNDIGLDFGAVDVVWNDHYQRAVVLEVNTAPGIEGTTVQKYAEAIRKYTRP